MVEVLGILGFLGWLFLVFCEWLSHLPVFPALVVGAIAVPLLAIADLDRKSTRLNSSHRCIHSFPTRRSSDLWLAIPGFLRMAKPLPGLSRAGSRRNCGTSSRHSGFRSEEHTSELQSPMYTLFPYTTLFRSLVGYSWFSANG